MISFFIKKQHLLFIALFACFSQLGFAQVVFTGLYKNEVIEREYKRLPKKLHKSTTFVYYEPIHLPFIEDFSNYIGYPDTALWIGGQAFVNQSFAINPPTIGCATLDAINEKGKIYDHASDETFGADTLLSRPIRLDSIFNPFPRALVPADSVRLCFFFQPGGGDGAAWEVLGNAPDNGDSLILEFGYQTGNTVLLHYIMDTLTIADTLTIGDTIRSHCHPGLYIIADYAYYPGDVVWVPCDSVTGLETVWTKVWSSNGMTLKQFRALYGKDFQQVMVPVEDNVYFNKGFQFRFRNYASLEHDNNNTKYKGSNVDFWNIDYIRLDQNIYAKDTIIDDVAIVDNPGSMLKKYTSMPWRHFQGNENAELRTNFDLKLTNLFNATKNTAYNYTVYDENHNSIGSYSGGNQNLPPFSVSGYQNYAPHSKPTIGGNITFPTASFDSTELLIEHLFQEAGSGDKNKKNDTVRFLQKFHNYFAYDDGTPEYGYCLTTSFSPYETALAMEFILTVPDTLRAVDIYINHTMDNASGVDFTLTVWEDNQGIPGNELYSKLVSQDFSDELYGFQRFVLDNPLLVSGTIYVGYQTDGRNFLNVGFDQNNDSREYTRYKLTGGGGWQKPPFNVLSGTPMVRAVVGGELPVSICEQEKSLPLSARIYPNPAKDRLFIDLSEDIATENIQLCIYSITGQKIYEGAYSQEISLSNYLPGFYLLQLIDTKQKQVSNHKFMITQ